VLVIRGGQHVHNEKLRPGIGWHARSPKAWCAPEACGDVGGRCFFLIATDLVVVKTGVPDGG
jgi:hypothetical protein